MAITPVRTWKKDVSLWVTFVVLVCLIGGVAFYIYQLHNKLSVLTEQLTNEQTRRVGSDEKLSAAKNLVSDLRNQLDKKQKRLASINNQKANLESKQQELQDALSTIAELRKLVSDDDERFTFCFIIGNSLSVDVKYSILHQDGTRKSHVLPAHKQRIHTLYTPKSLPVKIEFNSNSDQTGDPKRYALGATVFPNNSPTQKDLLTSRRYDFELSESEQFILVDGALYSSR